MSPLPLPLPLPLPDIESLLPHRAPFRFVDAVVSLAPDGGQFELRLTADDPRLVCFAASDRLAPLCLVEALAQSSAALNGAARSEGQERGMLVQIDRAVFHAAAKAGETVVLTVKRTHTLGPLVRFAGRAEVSGRVLVEATFTVARQDSPGVAS